VEYTLDRNQIQQFGSLEFLARQVVEGFITGLHKSPFHGFSVEFAEHRLYNTGESTRNIDWKLYGRTEKLFVKRFEEETNLRCQIIIDNSSSMYFPVRETHTPELPDKITFSVYAAASLMYLLQKQRDAVGLSIFSGTIEKHIHARSSSVHHKHLFSELEKLLPPLPPENKKQTFAVEALHYIAEMIHKRSLVVIFSDMMDSGENQSELFSALQHLKHNKHEVILFHVMEKQKEQNLVFENRPLRFIDLETGEELKLNPAEVKKQYVQTMQNFSRELSYKCGAYGIDYVEANINFGYKQILLPYIVKREKMH
jgi:uncharacterized protein (DUF58 family)